MLKLLRKQTVNSVKVIILYLEKTFKTFWLKRITWKFIVEKAAWWGGMWEGLVHSVKMCLCKVVGKASLKHEEMETLLTEVEAYKFRPHAFTHTERDELIPLMRSHFLLGQRLTTLSLAGSAPSIPQMEAMEIQMTVKSILDSLEKGLFTGAVVSSFLLSRKNI